MTEQTKKSVPNIATTSGQQTIANAVTNDFDELVKNQHYAVPENYNVANALQGAVLTIGNDRNLSTASLDSIRKVLFDMCVQGLSVSKTQCYFIKYGNELQMQRSYFGTQTILKRLPEIKDIHAEVVREGDEFEIGYVDGVLQVINHGTKFENMDNDFIGAYAVIDKTDGTKQYEIMTRKMIDTSWSQAKTKNVQQKFGSEMAKRTVINRAAKNIINTTGGDDRLVNAINDTTKSEYDEDEIRDVTPKQNVGIVDRLKAKREEKKTEGVKQPEAEIVDDKAENRKVVERMAEKEQPKEVDLLANVSDDGYKATDGSF